MYNDKKLASLVEQLEPLIPQRKIKKIFFYDEISLNKNERNKMQSPDILNSVVKKDMNNFFNGLEDIPWFRYVVHSKWDGEITSALLGKKMAAFSEDAGVVHNPEIEENDLSFHIRRSELKKRAIEEKLIEKKMFPLLKTISLILSGIVSAFIAFKEMIGFFTGAEDITVFLKASGTQETILYFLCISIFLLIAVWMCVAKHKSDIDFFKTLREKLEGLPDEQFFDFIKSFSPDEFQLPAGRSNKVFTCSLDHYNDRQKYILLQYFKSLSDKQLWWIFVTRPLYESENEFILHECSNETRRIAYFELLPLSAKDKKKLAGVAYQNQVKFKPERDAGLKQFGVDYIFRHQFKKNIAVDAKKLQEKIMTFCTMHSGTANHMDIGTVLNLATQLVCNYEIDFHDKQTHRLFQSGTNGDALSVLDMELSDELGINNRDFNKLIPDIVYHFDGWFDEMLIGATSGVVMDSFEQWCLVKALKSCSSSDDRRYMAIADAIMNKFESARTTPDELRTSVWARIIVQTVEVFNKNQQFWFLPTLIHYLLFFYGKNSGTEIKIFSDKLILDVVRKNLLLNFNTSTEKDAYFDIDLIQEHYEVLCLAVAEKDSKFNLDREVDVPLYFDILRLTNLQRKRYYNALTFLSETKVLEYYEYLFDMFCAELGLVKRDIKFCVKSIYRNSLHDKYCKKDDCEALSPNDYIRFIIANMLNMLEELFSDIDSVSEGIKELLALLLQSDSDNSGHTDLFLIAKLDIIGADTLSFIACLLARMKKADGLSEDIYLNLGNYLISLIFLTYHENSLVNYYNNDFLHLISICVSYEEPSNVILGYLAYCDEFSKPDVSRQMIVDYINQHKTEYVANISEVVSDIDVKEAEGFVVYILCTTCLENKEKIEILELLRQKLREKYFDSPDFPALNEILTLVIDNSSSEEFDKNTPEDDIAILLKTHKNTVCLAYEIYLNLYPEKYLKLCPLVAKTVLNSTIVPAKWEIVFRYIASHDSEKSNQYPEVCCLLYKCIKNEFSYCTHVWILNKMVAFIRVMLDKKRTMSALYDWLDEAEADRLMLSIVERAGELNLICAKEYLAERTVVNYGIALYMKALMKDVGILDKVSEYRGLNESEKIDYIIQNFESLEPMGTEKGKYACNEVYFDMLTAFIQNTEDIQRRLGRSEKDCLLKFANDALTLIPRLLIFEEVKSEITSMINDYIAFIMKS